MLPYPTHLYLTDEEYLRILQNLKEEIKNQAKLVYANSDEMGNNYNYCSWGLCSISRNIAPEPAMHLWPKRFVNESKFAMKYRQPIKNARLIQDSMVVPWVASIHAESSIKDAEKYQNQLKF